MTYELHKQIVKGRLAGHATTLAEIERVTEKDLAKILREIADELDKKHD